MASESRDTGQDKPQELAEQHARLAEEHEIALASAACCDPDAEENPTVVEGTFPIVGIGASAGGLSTLEQFFEGMRAATEDAMALLIVQHLDPHHKSILCELIRNYTQMEVYEVTDGMEVRPNCVYVIPPQQRHDPRARCTPPGTPSRAPRSAVAD